MFSVSFLAIVQHFRARSRANIKMFIPGADTGLPLSLSLLENHDAHFEAVFEWPYKSNHCLPSAR
jgi:hypothetical protein